MQRGTLVVLILLGVAVTAAAVGLWYRYQAGRRALAFWTPEAATLIAAGEAELLLLEPAGESAEDQTIVRHGERAVAVADRHELTAVPGVSHLRQALLQDASFAWDQRPSADCRPWWPYALRFHDEGREVVVLLDLDCKQAMVLGKARRVSIAPITEGLERFIQEQLKRSAK